MRRAGQPASGRLRPAGYRYANVRPDAGEEELFVILAFSGGGTRAAAFSYGVLEGLRTVAYRSAAGADRTLLDDVDVISSVSGGSFTAAHYALFGPEGFKRTRVKDRPFVHLLDGGSPTNYSFETVQLMAEHFRRLTLDRRDYEACEDLATQQCAAFRMPFDPPADVTLDAVELAFDGVTDDDNLKECLEGLATSFQLPRAQVTLLRQVAQRLLMTSAPFLRAMRTIAPSWPPRAVTIDPALVAEACPKS